MAKAGPNYECNYLDGGTNGPVNDGGVWNQSELPHIVKKRSTFYRISHLFLLVLLPLL